MCPADELEDDVRAEKAVAPVRRHFIGALPLLRHCLICRSFTHSTGRGRGAL